MNQELLEEELNWFAEDPAPVAPPPVAYKLRSSVSRIRTSRSDGGRAKFRGELNYSDSTVVSKSKSRDEASSSKTSKHDDSIQPRKSKSDESEGRKSKSDDATMENKLAKLQSDLLGKQAKSFVEKLSILEERDKLLRIALEKEKLTKPGKPSAQGYCPDMCPEKERILRDVRGIVSSHEAFPDTNLMDHFRAVKEYARSSADQEEPLPHELRPIPILRMTMDYLITEIICKLDTNDGENVGVWYDFCWGRLRAIRKDIIQQQFCDINTVTIVEECARFHIACFDRLLGSSKSVFDDKINSETLMNCLQSLMYMYEDLRKQQKYCPNEPEFRAYMVLLKLHSGFVLSEFQQFPLDLQKSQRVREAVDIHTAYSNNMYSSYFMLLKKTTYLNACLMQRFFGHLRSRAIEIIVKSHCPPNKMINISVNYLLQTLKFDNAEDCITFSVDFGLLLNNDGNSFSVSRNDFYLPDTIFTEGRSSSLVVNKRIPVAQSVLGHKDLPKIIKHEVHSSFSNDHFLNPDSLDASDQEIKLLREVTERSMIDRRSTEVAKVDTDESSEVLSTVSNFSPLEMMEEELISISDVDMSPDMPYVSDEEEEVMNELPEAEINESFKSELNVSDESETQSSTQTTQSLGESDLSDSDCYSANDLETQSQVDAISPIKLATTPPEAETKLESSVRQKTPEPPAPFFNFNHLGSQNAESFIEMSEPFKTLSPHKVIDTPFDQTSNKRSKSDLFKATQRKKIENENNLLMAKLRKKLSEKMKRSCAKKYAQVWKAKVAKIKKSRQSDSSTMRHISTDVYMKLWGCAQTKYTGRTLDRLQKRKKANILVTALLHLNIIDQLDSQVKAVGDRIAEILGRTSVRWAEHFGNIAQPQPVFWKLVLCLPRSVEVGAQFSAKLRYWCQAAFHSRINPKESDLCAWRVVSRVPVFIHPVIIEGLDEIERTGQNFSAAVLVRAEGWESAEETAKRLEVLTSMITSPVSLAVLTLGKEIDRMSISEGDRNKFSFVQQTNWKDADSFASTLMSLAQHHHMDNLKVQSLGYLVEMATEKLLDTLHQDQYLNEELSVWLTEPNYIIELYNRLVDALEEEIFQCCFYNYYNLAGELQPLVRQLKNSYDIFPAHYENPVEFKSILSSHLQTLKLATFKWNFTDSLGLMAELKEYCNKMQCSGMFSKLIRMINPPDSDSGSDLSSHLMNIPWLPIVELIAKQRISREAFFFKVVFREDKFKELFLSHWWLKI